MALKLFAIPEVSEVEEHDYFIINNDNKDVRMVSFQHVRDNISTNTGTVVSVNGQQGVITLDADDIDDAATAHKFISTAQLNTLASAIQAGDLATVATTGNYSDISGTPTLASVATSGSYNDLSNKPSIPAAAPVDSVNGAIGAVTIDADDINDDSTTHRFVTLSQRQSIGSAVKIQGAAVPATASASGVEREVRVDGSFVYFYIGTGWVRAALSTWT